MFLRNQAITFLAQVIVVTKNQHLLQIVELTKKKLKIQTLFRVGLLLHYLRLMIVMQILRLCLTRGNIFVHVLHAIIIPLFLLELHVLCL